MDVATRRLLFRSSQPGRIVELNISVPSRRLKTGISLTSDVTLTRSHIRMLPTPSPISKHPLLLRRRLAALAAASPPLG